MSLKNILLLTVCVLSVYGQPVVETKYGKLRGATKSKDGQEYDQFVGVPYSKPPVGDLRFQKPQPPESWEGTRDAVEYGYTCWQMLGMFPEMEDNLMLDNAKTLNEDCLTLNIFRPAKKSAGPRAVMVWVHGGGFFYGWGSAYQGWHLALHGDVIVITINYRLGIFGFFNTGDDVIPGNYGLWDQLMALQWVQDNIEAFGGDKSRVTVFGESAGGMSVSALAITPKSQGLFNRVIIMSGTITVKWSLLEDKVFAWGQAQDTGKAMNCTDVTSSKSVLSCLKKADAEALFNASLASVMVQNDEAVTFPIPANDGDFFPKPARELVLDNPVFNDRDIMAGLTNADGGIFLFFRGYNLTEGVTKELARNITKDWTRGYSKTNPGSVAKAIEDEYFESGMSDIERGLKTMDILTAMNFGASTLDFVNEHKGKGNTYLFNFTHTPPDHVLQTTFPDWFTNGALHGDELIYLFGIDNLNLRNVTFSDEDEQLSRKMMTYFTDFAKYGNPSDDWPKFSSSGREYMDIATTSTARSGFLGDKADFWLNKIKKIAKEAESGEKKHEEL